MALDLGQVEIRPGTSVDGALGVVEEIETEIEQRAGNRLAVDSEVVFEQMPSTRPHQEYRRPVRKLVGFLCLQIDEIEFAGPAVLQVDLPVEEVVPAR